MHRRLVPKRVRNITTVPGVCIVLQSYRRNLRIAVATPVPDARCARTLAVHRRGVALFGLPPHFRAARCPGDVPVCMAVGEDSLYPPRAKVAIIRVIQAMSAELSTPDRFLRLSDAACSAPSGAAPARELRELLDGVHRWLSLAANGASVDECVGLVTGDPGYGQRELFEALEEDTTSPHRESCPVLCQEWFESAAAAAHSG